MRTRSGWQREWVRAIAGLALVAYGCSRGSEPAVPVAATPEPAQLLQVMFDTLAHARTLTFKATRQLDAALAVGGSVAESASIEVWVSRPQMIRARSTSEAGARVFYADGQHVSLIDEGMKVYATAPLPGTIDDVVNALDERYGFTPPLAEFVLNDPSKKFATQIQSSQYKGSEAVNGVECNHIALTGEVADADLWISIADHLPRRLVATFKDREGSPQLKVDFSDWNLTPSLEASLFVFDPPKDAYKIAMRTSDDANAGDAKGGTR